MLAISDVKSDFTNISSNSNNIRTHKQLQVKISRFLCVEHDGEIFSKPRVGRVSQAFCTQKVETQHLSAVV